MKIILGDNPFFSINHRDGGFGNKVSIKDIGAVLSIAIKCGIELMMISAHPGKYEAIIKELGHRNKLAKNQLAVALVTPLPHKFNDIAASSGYFGVIKSLGIKAILYSITFSILYLARLKKLAHYFGGKLIMELLSDDLKFINQHNVSVTHICMHNIFTDLILALGRREFLDMFAKTVIKAGKTPVFITQNISKIFENNIPGSIVCCSLNSNGYMMTPDQGSAEEIIRNQDMESIWAMQILAGGAISPSVALEYLDELGIKNCLYASIKPERIAEFVE